MSALPTRRAAVVGAGMSAFVTKREDLDLAEILQDVSEAALRDAGLDMSDVDAVVLAQGPDPMHGIGHPEQTAAAALACHGKPMLRVHTGGATGISAAQTGWWAVTSGRFETVLVVGAEKMGDNTAGAQRVLNEIWDPAYEAPMPLNTIANASLMAVRYMQRHDATELDFAEIASRVRANGSLNPNAHLRKEISPAEVLETRYLTWPVRMGTSCPRSTGGCAAVLTSADVARRLSAPAAWIRGFASRTDTYFMGDRMAVDEGYRERTDTEPDQYLAMENLRDATLDAYGQAGIVDPAAEIDVVEPYVPFSSYEPMMLEAMRFCSPGTAIGLGREGFWSIDGSVAVSPSGGVLCANPISVTALVRFVECAQQVRGLAGPHQVDGARTAVAVGAGGDSQFYGVAVLDARHPEEL